MHAFACPANVSSSEFDYRFRRQNSPKRIRLTAERGRGLKRKPSAPFRSFSSVRSFLRLDGCWMVHARTHMRALTRVSLARFNGHAVIADTQHSKEDTYAMRRLLSPRHFAAAPVTMGSGGDGDGCQLQTPEEYTDRKSVV